MTAYPNECCPRASMCSCQVQTLNRQEVERVLSSREPRFVMQDSRNHYKAMVLFIVLLFILVGAVLMITAASAQAQYRPPEPGVMWTPNGWRATPTWLEGEEEAPRLAPPPMALPPGARLVEHNGSIMALEPDPQTREVFIRYLQPRPGMAEAGAEPGMWLVRGRWTPRGLFVGTAFVFSAACGRSPYRVEGRTEGLLLVLRGPSPIIAWDCSVSGYAWTPNSTLVFRQVRG